jgi:voltage-gated potassium channel
MIEHVKKRVYEILEVAETDDKISRYFDIFIIILICLNVVAVILETVARFATYKLFFNTFERISVLVFTIEYIFRVWACNLDEGERFRHPIKGRIRYIFTWGAIIDLLAFFPFYIPYLIRSVSKSLDLRFLRALRLLRLLRLLKLGRYTAALQSLFNVFKSKKEELVTSVFVVLILLILTSSVMFYVENAFNPGTFANIPEVMWWGIVTLTTVGYGDICPVSPFGRTLGGFVAILGIAMVALPGGIIASGFVEEFRKKREGIVDKVTIKEHVVICGWNYQGTKIVEDLVNEQIFDEDSIIILANLENTPHQSERITFINGNPWDKKNLEKANMKYAKSALILANPDIPNPDAETLMITLAIEKNYPNVYTSVQLNNSANEEHLKNAGADEIICFDRFGADLAVSSAVTHGISKIINELLTFNKGSEIYRYDEKIPDYYIGKGFREIAKILLEKNIILLAVETDAGDYESLGSNDWVYSSKENKIIVINPQNEYKIKKDDVLYIISLEKPEKL